VLRSDDLGQTWRQSSTGLTTPHVRWLAYHPDISDREFAGTEPAGIFVSHDGAQTWRECAEVTALRAVLGWHLPYSPAAGCVRGFAFHGQRAYAAAEVGGVLRSDDGGAAWQMVGGSFAGPDLDVPAHGPLVYPDVHAVCVHPSSPDLVYAPTGAGLYRSSDGGQRWDNLYECYCRAIWLDPADANHIIFGPASAPQRGGWIAESRDGGAAWQAAPTPADIPWQRCMVEQLLQVGDDLLAVLSDGGVLLSGQAEPGWRQILGEVTGVVAATAMG
jgi:hypothetical protein